VKVIRDVSSNTDYFEQLKTVGFISAGKLLLYLFCTLSTQKLLREAKVWNQLDHPNITPFYGICFDLGLLYAPCLICPYFKNGNLAKYLEKSHDADRMKLVSSLCA
jgi:serine/threonine protein kinase